MTLFHHDHHKDSTDEWATPAAFVQPLADALGGFDLDPAAGAEDHPHASTQYTADDDGLSEPWFGTVWCNPPFSAKADWLRKARREIAEGRAETVVMLLPVDTSTQWFHEHVVRADLLWFKEGRLSFRGGGGRNRNPNFGVMIAVFGEVPVELCETLSHRGVVFETDQRYQEYEQEELPT